MFSDQDLASMVDQPYEELAGEDMHNQLMDPNVPPDLQMQMMEAARRRLGGGGL
jgi:hypothetical protein